MRKFNIDDECSCDQQCPGQSCACIYIHDEQLCICQCSGAGGAAFLTGHALPLDTLVSISVKNTDLGTLGGLLSNLCDAELTIPATLVKKEVTFKLKKTKLASVIKKSGLAFLNHEQTRR
jgi:hypothetical protein